MVLEKGGRGGGGVGSLFPIDLPFILQGRQLAELLDEDPALMERRQRCARRLELYRSARDEIDAVSWSR